jgi:hypothetical protein
MELSFAIGNMFGATDCSKDDYRQLGDILEAWECRKTGGVKEELDNMRDIVKRAVAIRGGKGQKVPQPFCEDLWYTHNRLVNNMNIFDDQGIGLGARGPVPPNVKGPPGVKVMRTLDEIREKGWPKEAPENGEEAPPPAVTDTDTGRHYEGHAGRHEEGHEGPPLIPGEPHFRGRPVNDQKPKHFRGRPVEPARAMGYGDGEERRKRWYPDQ